MNITQEKVDDLNAVVTIKVEEADYQQRVEKVLKDYKRKAKVDGFRPGMVPMGMIRKMYYTPVLVDEINHLVSESLMNYIREEKLQILGEPLPHENDQKQIDFESMKEFEFSFDLGMAPEFSVEISDKDKIPYYDIVVEDRVIDEYIDNVAKRYGDFIPVEEATGDELVKAALDQTDEHWKAIEDGISLPEVSMSLDMMKDEEQKKLFIGKKPGDKIQFNIKKAYPNDVELGTMLKVKKEEVEGLAPHFEAVINEILKFEKRELNQDFFDELYGDESPKSNEEFRAKVSEQIKVNYERESDYKFALDAKDFLIEKANIGLPSEFLKRWMLDTNKEMDVDKLNEEFAEYEKAFRWQLVRDKVIRSYEIKVSEEEVFEYARILTRNQFFQYGLYNVTDEQIDQFTRDQLSKPEETRRLHEQKYDDKTIRFIKDTAGLDKKEINPEKFKELFEK